MKCLSRKIFKRIFYVTMITCTYLVSSCNIDQKRNTPTIRVLEPPAVLQTSTPMPPSPTFNSQPTPEPEPSTSPTLMGPNYLKAHSADIRIDKWSSDGQWLAYWLSEPEDLTYPSFPAPLGRLHFLNSQNSEICEHLDFISSLYESSVYWLLDNRVMVYNEEAYWLGYPCGDFRKALPSEVSWLEILDPSLSPDGSYWVQTDVQEETDLFIKLITTVMNVSNGELENHIEWEIDQGVGEVGLGGEWVTNDIFLIFESRNKGPLLIQVGEEEIQIASELFRISSSIDSTQNDWVGLKAYASNIKGTNTYHIILVGTGLNDFFPPIRLYHSETGEVEELPYTHIWDRGFTSNGDWVLLDSRPEQDNYESYALWIRPVDPPGSQLQLIEEGTYQSRWSPDQNKIAFGRVGSFSVLTFPTGEEITSWETGEYSISNLVWSPKSDLIAAVGNIPGEFDAALFIVPVP